MNSLSFDISNVFKTNIDTLFLQFAEVMILNLSRKYNFDHEDAMQYINNSLSINYKSIDEQKPIEIEKKTIEIEPIEIEKKPNVIEQKPIVIEQKPIEIEKKPIVIEPIEIEQKPIEIEPIEIEQKPIEIEQKPNKKNKKTFIKPNIVIPFCNQIYNDWINDQNNPLKLLKAQSLIQPSNIMDYFRSYNGKYNFNNRDECVKELLNKPNNSWILRNSSIKDTDIQKAYCLSFKKNDVIKHYLIIHKIGYGFYFGVKILRGKILKNNENFNYIKLYPSIIHLIQEQLSILSLVI